MIASRNSKSIKEITTCSIALILIKFIEAGTYVVFLVSSGGWNSTAATISLSVSISILSTSCNYSLVMNALEDPLLVLAKVIVVGLEVLSRVTRTVRFWPPDIRELLF